MKIQDQAVVTMTYVLRENDENGTIIQETTKEHPFIGSSNLSPFTIQLSSLYLIFAILTLYGLILHIKIILMLYPK